MDEVSAAGAEAVAVYFLQLYPYVYATNDLTEWRALSHPECIFCASVITNVEEQVAAGHHNDGSLIAFSTISASELDPGVRYAAQARITEGPSTELDATGAVVDQRPDAQDLDVTFAIVFDGTWLIREVDVTVLQSAS